MTAPVALLALLPLAARDAPSRPPVPFEQRGKWGYRDTRGAVVIPPRFDLAKPFSPEGLAAVVDNQGWAYIDTAGKLVIRPLVFDNGPDYFRENLARFTEAGKYGFLQGGAWGFIDRTGALVIPARFQEVRPFQKSRAKVKLNGQWQSIGKDGLPLAGK